LDKLPIFTDPPRTPIEIEPPVDVDHSCTKCELSQGVSTVCMAPEGEPGGVLIISDYPGEKEDSSGRPFVGASGQFLRQVVDKYWTGPVAYDNAIKCMPGKREVSWSDVDACRGYAAAVLREVQPSRVIACGARAINTMLGRAPSVFSVRKGYGWIYDVPWAQPEPGVNGDARPIPVYMLMNPAASMRNRFIKQWFIEDMRWALTAPIPARPLWNSIAYTVDNGSDAMDAEDDLRSAPWVAFDVETAGKMFTADFRLLSVALSVADTGRAWAWDARSLSDPHCRSTLISILTDRQVSKVGQSSKYDMLAIRCALGVWCDGVDFDTRLIRRLVESDAEANLQVMGELVGMGGHKDEAGTHVDTAVAALRGSASATRRRLRKAGLDIDKLDLRNLDPADEAALRLGADPYKYAYAQVPRDVLLRYNAADTIVTGLVRNNFEARLQNDPTQRSVWVNLVQEANYAITQVEEWGIAADRPAILNFQAYLETKIASIRQRFNSYDKDFNPGSTKMVQEILFKRLALKPIKFTETKQPSTDKESLEALRGRHPLVDDILEYRRLTKLKGTYADSLIAHVCDDGRIHCIYNIDGARSGRMSSEDPNMQNLPSAKASIEGKMARDCFIAAPGHVLIEVDNSQIELRIAADLSGDPLMLQIFHNDEDYHQRTAEMVSKQAWKIEAHQVTEAHRDKAKIVNFRCVSMDTRILTRQGWKSYDEVQVGDETPGRTGWVKVLEKVKYDSAPVVDWQGFRVTPNHRWWSTRRTGGSSSRYEVEEFTTLETVTSEHRICLSRSQSGFGCGMTPDECAILGWIVTDGHTNTKNVYIHQSRTANHEKLAEIKSLLNRAGVCFTQHDRPSGITALRLRDPKGVWRDRVNSLSELTIISMTAAERAGFIRAGLLAEGHQQKGRWRFTQNPGRIAEIYRLAFFLDGNYVRQWVDVRRTGRYAGRTSLKLALSKPYITGQRLSFESAGDEAVWCVRTEDETWTMRRGDSIAITGNTLYGGSDYANAKAIGCSVEEAAILRQAIFGKFTVLARWIDQQVKDSQKTGFAWTYWDGQKARRRMLYRIGDADEDSRQVAEHGSFNTPIQGTASDYCLASLAAVVRWIKENQIPAKLVATVHDSLLIEARIDVAERVANKVVSIMTGWPTMNGVPLRSDIKVGRAWGSLLKVKT